MHSVIAPTLVFSCIALVAAGCHERTASTADPLFDSGQHHLDRTTPAPLERLEDPCGGRGTPHIHADSERELVIGCDNGAGLWHSTDGGKSFSQSHSSRQLHVFDIARFRDGTLWVCGQDTNGALVYRGQVGGPWEAMLSDNLDATSKRKTEMTSCGTLAEGPNGQPVVASLTEGTIAWFHSDGQDWEAATTSEPQATSPRPPLLVGSNGRLFGTGGDTHSPPVFVTHRAPRQPTGQRPHSIQIARSAAIEVWALASPDHGITWLAGGTDRAVDSIAGRRAEGVMYTSRDGGAHWHPIELPEEIAIVRHIAFSKDGRRGVAVGHRAPSSGGGFALFTTDSGRSWAIEDRLPMLESADVAGDTYWLAGDAYLSRGRF